MVVPSPMARIAFASNPFAASPSWDDISTDVISVNIRKGRQHELNRMEAGRATIVLLNTSGNYWPDNTGGSYYPNIKPLKRVNVRVTYNAINYDLYTGFVEEWTPDFILKPIKGAVMVLTCTDLVGCLAKLLLNDATGYSQELSGIRIGNVLDDVAWPVGARDLDTGQSNMQATGPLANENSLDHSFKVQDSEKGLLWIAGDGDVQFQDRHARLKSPYTTSQATFGDGIGEMKYHRLTLGYGSQYILNDIRLTRAGGTEQVAEDATSKTSYGQRSYSRTGLLMTTNAECLSQAQYLLKQYKDPALRVKNITIRPGVDEANLYPKVFGYGLSTRITIKLAQASLSRDYYIEGLSQDWRKTDAHGWETKWELSLADSQQYWILGIAGSGELGQKTYLCY